MKVSTLIAVALLVAGPGLSTARAAGGISSARSGTSVIAPPMTGWSGAPVPRLGRSLRAPGTDLGLSIAHPNVPLTPGIELAAPVAARPLPPGPFGAATRLTGTLSREASLKTLLDVEAGDSRRLSAAGKIYDDSAAVKDAAEVPGAFSPAESRLTASMIRAREKVREIEKITRRAEKAAAKAGARVDWGDIGRWSAALVALAAGLGAVLYGLHVWAPGLFALIRAWTLVMLALAGAGALVWLGVAAGSWLRDRFGDRDW